MAGRQQCRHAGRQMQAGMQAVKAGRQAQHTGSNARRRQADRQSKQAGSAGCRHASGGERPHLKIAAEKGILAWQSMRFVLHKGILAYARFRRLREILGNFQKNCPIREFLPIRKKRKMLRGIALRL